MRLLLCIMIVLPALVYQSSAKIRYRSLKSQKIGKRTEYKRQSDEGIDIAVVIGDELWENAETYCEEQGGILLTIPEEDLEFDIEEYLDEDHLEEEFWIGANDIAQEGAVVWADGSKVLWEPDDDAENDKDKNCVALSPEDDGSFSWKFRDCSEEKNFLCQIPDYDTDILDPEENPCCDAPDPGQCEGRIPRYYYDCKKKTCEIFMWGGCDEALNNFPTAEECEWVCADTDAKPGECPEVEDFDYCEPECDFDGECDGDLKCCDNGCAYVCTQPLARGPCDDGSFPKNCSVDPCSVLTCETAPRDKEISCRPNHCGGCLAEFYDEDDNLIDCKNYCCFPPDSGEGQSKEVMWYYDCEKGECEEFVYAGAGGNDNCFKTKGECHFACELWN